MELCENCGAKIDDDNETTSLCPECGIGRCMNCDAGGGTVCGQCEDAIARKLERQMARRRERAILEIQNAIIDEIARHNERLAAENARHREAIADYERELQGYNAENHQQEEVCHGIR